jgi:hypothetical protein
MTSPASFKNKIQSNINQLAPRKTLTIGLDSLPLLGMNRREFFGWIKAQNCYVKFVSKEKIVEVQKM